MTGGKLIPLLSFHSVNDGNQSILAQGFSNKQRTKGWGLQTTTKSSVWWYFSSLPLWGLPQPQLPEHPSPRGNTHWAWGGSQAAKVAFLQRSSERLRPQGITSFQPRQKKQIWIILSCKETQQTWVGKLKGAHSKNCLGELIYTHQQPSQSLSETGSKARETTWGYAQPDQARRIQS